MISLDGNAKHFLFVTFGKNSIIIDFNFEYSQTGSTESQQAETLDKTFSFWMWYVDYPSLNEHFTNKQEDSTNMMVMW